MSRSVRLLSSWLETHRIVLQAERRQVFSIRTNYGSKPAPSSISTGALSSDLKQPFEITDLLHKVQSLRMMELYLHAHLHFHGVHGDRYLAISFRLQALAAIQNIREGKTQGKVGGIFSPTCIYF
jgi:hypothetical protein